MALDKTRYTSANALEDLGGRPSDSEIAQLFKHYPSYQYVHRKQLLEGLFDGKTHEELVLGKMTAKGLDTSISKQAKGGHGRWVVAKVRNAAIRLLYLRYRLEQGLTQRQANQQLVKRFPFSNAKDGGRSIIRKITHSPVLDGSALL